jgi:hypothetical protein
VGGEELGYIRIKPLFCFFFFSGISDSEGERKRLLDVEAKAVPLHENADYIRSLYSQHIMSAASATAYGLIGLLMGFVNKVHTYHLEALLHFVVFSVKRLCSSFRYMLCLLKWYVCRQF